MKKTIELYLQSFGYSNIHWKYGRKGYFIIALAPYGFSECIEPQEIVNEMLDSELKLSKKHELRK